MSDPTISETNFNLKKVIQYIRISVLVNSIIIIPLIILAILSIGGNAIFILTIVFVGLLCLQFLVLVSFDISRIFQVRKNKENK
ncbi:MAG: hypothetical protein ACTSQK_08170 [Candidatus Heimdallarchaeota archaeon]